MQYCYSSYVVVVVLLACCASCCGAAGGGLNSCCFPAENGERNSHHLGLPLVLSAAVASFCTIIVLVGYSSLNGGTR